jgi:hypothetical protein
MRKYISASIWKPRPISDPKEQMFQTPRLLLFMPAQGMTGATFFVLLGKIRFKVLLRCACV